MNERLKTLYTQKHSADSGYGVTAPRHIVPLQRLTEKRKWKTILDYGCGKGVLSQHIPGIVNYDFAIPEYCHLPQDKFDAAVCIDVLEHIPESDLPETLEYLKEHALTVYFYIHLSDSLHKLPNGEPCHCTVKPAAWWIDKLSAYWNHIEIVNCGKLHLTVIAQN